MNKNTIIGLVLMALVLFGFSWYQQHNSPANGQLQTTEEKAPLSNNDKKSSILTETSSSSLDTSSTFFVASKDTIIPPVKLTNGKIAITIDPRGGQISQVQLLEHHSYADYKAGRKNALVLYDAKDAKVDFLIETKQRNLSTKDFNFQPESVTDSSVKMVMQGRNGEKICYDYKLTKDYMVDMKVSVAGMSQQISPRTTNFVVEWAESVRQQEKGYYFENMYSTLSYKLTDGENEKLNEQGDESEKANGTVHWVAFKNQYFSSVLIANDGFSDAEFSSKQLAENSGYLKHYEAKMTIPFDPAGKKATSLQWYFGPNNYRLLQSMEQHNLSSTSLDLQDLVYLGWPLIRWINRFFTIYVFDFLAGLNLPMWLVLVVITLLLRVIVYGPTRKSFLASAKMRVLRPKIDEIRAKYPNKEDALKMNQEIMQLYSLHGANMFGGCLPMLIQMPIWIAMFNFLPNAIEFRQQPFLWADDLSSYDDLISWSTNIWGVGTHLSIFCILFCVTNALFTVHTMRQQQEQMAATTSPDQAASMKMMQYVMLFMPVMFFFMFNKYSAGLNFYYFLSLLASLLTTWFLRATTDDATLLTKLEAKYKENMAKPKKANSGGFMARIQALQEQAEEMKAEQQKRKDNQ